jgi:hypothetical protein
MHIDGKTRIMGRSHIGPNRAFKTGKFFDIDNQILNNKTNHDFLENIVGEMLEYRTKLDWQMEKFLEDHCKGVHGLDQLDHGGSEPHKRYYATKCAEYSEVERAIRVATAYL